MRNVLCFVFSSYNAKSKWWLFLLYFFCFVCHVVKSKDVGSANYSSKLFRYDFACSVICFIIIVYGFAPTLWSFVLCQSSYVFCLHRFVFSWDFKWLFFRFPIGLLLLFWLSFSVCYCSGNNHSRSSLLDFCSCCWSSKIVGYIYMFCCLFPFMVCQSDGCCCQCCSFSCYSSVDANCWWSNIQQALAFATIKLDFNCQLDAKTIKCYCSPKSETERCHGNRERLSNCCHIVVLLRKNHRA